LRHPLDAPVTASRPTRCACSWGLPPTTWVIACAGSSCRSPSAALQDRRTPCM